jgi:hypothetical protein
MEQIGITRDRPGVEHRGPGIEARCRRGGALCRRPDRLAYGEPCVPQRIEHRASDALGLIRLEPFVHQQHVDVGKRELAPTSIATESRERDPWGSPCSIEERRETHVQRTGPPLGRPSAVMAA